MTLENMDFQSLVHQMVSQMMMGWQEKGYSEELCQEDASQCFNMGMIATQQLQKEGGIQPQGTDQLIPYNEEMGTKIATSFMIGLNAAIEKSLEMQLPSKEKWQLLQNVAFHVFEQSKQAIIATLGQENTPEVQITDDQIYEWLGNTAIEALVYYINEYEKQNGPLVKPEIEGNQMPDLLSPEPQPEPEPQSLLEDNPYMEEPIPEEYQPEPEPVAQQPQAPPDVHHKYAAVGLLLNTISDTQQTRILSNFNDDQKNVIMHYRNPDVVAASLDMAKVMTYLKSFKEKLGDTAKFGKSRYGATVSRMIQSVPRQRLAKLFQNERPLVKGYIQQILLAADGKDSDLDQFELPAGVEESLLLYLYRNFPQIADKLKLEEAEDEEKLLA